MKYCPSCKKQFDEKWITFCSEDGTILVEDFSPPRDPYWDPRVATQQGQPPSEQPTQWLPQQPQSQPWTAPTVPPPAGQPWQQPSPLYTKSPSQGLAIASMITGLLGLFAGMFCLGPIPGLAALILGLVALSQIKNKPLTHGGKPLAIIGIVTGSVSLVIYGGMILLWIVSLVFS